MKACDTKLKSCLIKAMMQEEDQLREELLHTKPHVFSAQFEQVIDEAMGVHKSEEKFRGFIRYVAAVIVVAFLTGSILCIGSENLFASNISVDILQWLEEFFTMDVKNPIGDKADILFEESQIGYLPEGFEKVGEEVRNTHVKYVYKNSEEKVIRITVHNSNFGGQHDNVNVENYIRQSETGIEYSVVYNQCDSIISLIWQDDKGLYYKLESNLEEAELIKILDNFSY